MKVLEKLSSFQYKHAAWILLIALIITTVLGIGISKVSMQSDMDQMMPQDLEIFKVEDRIQDNFGGQDGSFVLIRIEEPEENGVYDIRDPRIIEFLVELKTKLEKEDLIESTQSIGAMFTIDTIPPTLDYSKQIFSSIAGVNAFFNKDYSATMMIISSDLGGGEDKIKELDSIINEALSETSKPDGVTVYITGTPQIRSMILDLLASDAVFTILIAALMILVLLIILEKSATKALLIFTPLLFGISWTLGTMGWLDIQLSVATVGIGAMILGLGVEYGVFIVSRYSEERENKSSKKSLKITVQEVGSSVLGSGTTTIMGFLALTFSMMPMLRDLGLSLALGIAFSLTAAIFINPALIVLEERFEHLITEKKHKRLTEKTKQHAKQKALNEKNH